MWRRISYVTSNCPASSSSVTSRHLFSNMHFSFTIQMKIYEKVDYLVLQEITESKLIETPLLSKPSSCLVGYKTSIGNSFKCKYLQLYNIYTLLVKADIWETAWQVVFSRQPSLPKLQHYWSELYCIVEIQSTLVKQMILVESKTSTPSSSSVTSLHLTSNMPVSSTSRGFFNGESLSCFPTLPHHCCCLPPSPPSGQSLEQNWQSLQCFLSVLVPILVA